MTRTFGKHFALALVWALCIVFPCAAAGLAEDAPAPPDGGYARTIFVNGAIVTVDPAQPEVQALAVAADGSILAVGAETVVRKYELKGTTEVVDLNKKTLMPGFVEPHTHAFMTAFNANNPIMVNLSSFERKPMTVPAIVKKLQDALKQEPIKGLTAKGGWLLAFGVDPARTDPFMEGLNAKKLDEVSKTVPIFVLNQSGHLAYVNTTAIELADIRADDQPAGGVYVTKVNELTHKLELTGELEEAPAYKPFQALAANSASGVWFDKRKQKEALIETYKQFAEAGVTTATEMSLGLVTGKVQYEYGLLEEMAAETPLVRIRAYVSALATSPEKLAMEPNKGDDLFKVIGIKFVADGSTQGLSAALEKPYDYPATTKNEGTLNYPIPEPGTDGQLFGEARRYAKRGWQLSIHSNGDRATNQVLAVYEKLLGDNPDQDARDKFAARRFRIEHLTVTEDSQLDRINALGLTPSMTNGHVYFWGYALGDPETKIIGWERTQRIDPAKSLLKRKVPFSFNSDAPITPVAPLRYISTAVTRLWQNPPTEPLPDDDNQGIDVDAAIKAVTLDAAYQLFLDKEIGSLNAGKRADLVILEKNPRTTTPKDIMDIRVLATYLGGSQRYGAPVPEYGSLQNDSNAEYRCNRATHLAGTYTAADCLMRFVRKENGTYTIQNLKNHQYFQGDIGTMADSADTDLQEWDIVGANGRYTIQNRSNHEYMTSHASQLSSTLGPGEYWTIEERLKP
jgi:predicted amidohydrolase YtcJ